MNGFVHTAIADHRNLLIPADPIHQLDLPDYVKEFIYTVQFQRLRNIKQLGACNYVFTGTNHSRLEHCIGVSYLANIFIETLEKNSTIRAAPFFRKCVVLAGLLHDIGHGPYSHMWEHCVRQGEDKKWTHEETSGEMVKHLIQRNAIRLSNDDNEHCRGVQLIVSLICGDTDTSHAILGDDQFFLAEVVNNKFSLIDVDKWDYLLRDSHYVRHITSIRRDFERCFSQAKVCRLPNTDDRRTHIGYHFSTYQSIRTLFANRAHMHRHVYQHVEVVAVEMLLSEIFVKAERSGFRLKSLKLSLVQCDLDVFTALNDSILDLIAISDIADPHMVEAQTLIRILKERQFRVHHDAESDKILVEFTIGHIAQKLTKRRHLPSALGSMPSHLILYDADDSVNLVETSK